MSPADHIAWAEAQEAAGKRDAMGKPFTSWLLARYHPDGRAVRDKHGHQVFQTQAEFKAESKAHPITLPVPGQNLELFA